MDLLGLLDPYVFWHQWNEQQRQNWFSDFRRKYDGPIDASANENCVPKRLLAAIIANEMIDYSTQEQVGEWLGFGQSLGPAQITIKTAIKYSLTDFDRSQFQDRYTYMKHDVRRVSADEQYRHAVRSYLENPAKNISAAGRLMRRYLDEFCSRAASGSFSFSFLTLAPGIAANALCCESSRKPCPNAVNFDPGRDLIRAMAARAMAAAWNNDIGIADVSDLPRKSPNAFNNALWAGRLIGAPIVNR